MTEAVPTPSLLAAPDGGLDPRVVETHTAVVFFVGDRVYKLKKAADLGFLDHRTLEARRRACQDEVDLNRRLAPDVYLGVLDVAGPDHRTCEHLVAMRRLPDERRLSRCLERGEDLDATLRAVAHAVATLHARSARSATADRNADVEAVGGRWADGFEVLARTVDEPTRTTAATIERLVRRYLDGRGALFRQRVDEGRIRDGHGDLQADDIFVLDDGPRILDCIEFGDDYRWGDVLADVAFLAMDLERRGRPDLARTLLARHRELGDDPFPSSLAHHYVAYRAHVRAKVAALRAEQTGRSTGREIDRLLEVALDHLDRARVRLVLVGGLPGTGKSTVAAGLGSALDGVVLRSDEIRKATAGLDAGYGPDAVAAVYAELLDQAARLLARGTSVVLDATWGDAGQRRLARAVAERTSSDLTELRCELPTPLAAERIGARQARGGDPSDATPAVAAALADRFAPWPEALAVLTDDAVTAVLDRAAALVRQHPPA